MAYSSLHEDAPRRDETVVTEATLTRNNRIFATLAAAALLLAITAAVTLSLA